MPQGKQKEISHCSQALVAASAVLAVSACVCSSMGKKAIFHRRYKLPIFYQALRLFTNYKIIVGSVELVNHHWLGFASVKRIGSQVMQIFLPEIKRVVTVDTSRGSATKGQQVGCLITGIKICSYQLVCQWFPMPHWFCFTKFGGKWWNNVLL